MIEEEWNFHSKLDYYLAQIAFLIDLLPARIWGDKDYRSELEDFLMTFSTGERRPSTWPKVKDVDRKLPPRRGKKKDKFAGVSKEDLARYGTRFDPKDMTPDEKAECEKSKGFFFSALLLDQTGKPTDALKQDMARRKAEGTHVPPKDKSRPRNNQIVRKDVKDGH